MGSMTSMLGMFGHIVYEEGTQKFATKPKRRTSPKQSRRWERKMAQLVKERCLLQKGQEKKGLKNPWEQIKSRLTHLR